MEVPEFMRKTVIETSQEGHKGIEFAVYFRHQASRGGAVFRNPSYFKDLTE
jgi:hypothetical protein